MAKKGGTFFSDQYGPLTYLLQIHFLIFDEGFGNFMSCTGRNSFLFKKHVVRIPGTSEPLRPSPSRLISSKWLSPPLLKSCTQWPDYLFSLRHSSFLYHHHKLKNVPMFLLVVQSSHACITFLQKKCFLLPKWQSLGNDIASLLLKRSCLLPYSTAFGFENLYVLQNMLQQKL